MRNTVKATAIERILPLLGVEDGCLLSTSGDVTIGYRLHMPEALELSEENFDLLHDTFDRGLQMMPSWSIIHKMDVLKRSCYTIPEKLRENIGFLQKTSNGHFDGRSYLGHETYLFLTLSSKEKMKKGYLKRSLFTGSAFLPLDVNKERIERFQSACRQFADILRSSGLIEVCPLAKEEILGDDNRTGLLEELLMLRLDESRKDIPGGILEDLALEGDRVSVGDKSLTCYTVSDSGKLPGELRSVSSYQGYRMQEGDSYPSSMLFPLSVDLDCPHIVNQYILLDDSRENLESLEQRLRYREAFSRYNRQNRLTGSSLNAYLERARRLQLRSIRTHINLMVFHEGNGAKDEASSKAVSALSKVGLTVHKESLSTPQLFFSMLPGCSSELPTEETFLSFPCEALCLFLMEGMNIQKSIPEYHLRFTSRLQNIPLEVDLSDEPLKKGLIGNRNKFVLGPSGSGKSFLMNHMVASAYQQGAHVLVIDTGGSYQGLTEIIREEAHGKDGQYMDFDEDHLLSYNPFSGIEDGLSLEHRESLTGLLLLLWKKPGEMVTRIQEQTLDQSLQEFVNYVREEGIQHPVFMDYIQFMRTDFRNYLASKGVRPQDFDLPSFLIALLPFGKDGAYEYLLNAREGEDLFSSRFTVFEIDRIKDHPVLFPITIVIIMELFIRKMRLMEGVRKVIVIEEAWKAIASTQMAVWIKYLFKTVRKFYGEAVLVTQDLEDIISSEIVQKSIINNSDCRMILDMRHMGARLTELGKVLGLTKMDLLKIQSLNQNPRGPGREVFVSLGSKSRVLRLEVCPEEYYAYTSDPEDRARLLEAEIKMGSRLEAIKALAAAVRNKQNTR